MESLIQNEGEVHSPSKLSQQALWFGIHTCLALGSWLLLMFVGYALQPSGISQLIITVLSLAVFNKGRTVFEECLTVFDELRDMEKEIEHLAGQLTELRKNSSQAKE